MQYGNLGRKLAGCRDLGRYALNLHRFLNRTVEVDDAPRLLRDAVSLREEFFLSLIDRAIFRNANSPYLPLLNLADCNFNDIQRMVHGDGLESTLHSLRDAGVYMGFEEFKGRRPVVRDGRVFTFAPNAFDNPLLHRDYAGSTSGSTGHGARVFMDLDFLAHEAVSHAIFLQGHGVLHRPMSLWRPLPPGVAGFNNVLRHAKIGHRVDRWFTQSRADWRGESSYDSLIAYYTAHAGRWSGASLPIPIHVPLGDARRIARWLEQKRQAGKPAIMDTNASSGVRICAAALEAGIDISDTWFRLGGEPYTPGKAAVVALAGCRAATIYAMAETGRIGLACPASEELDDVHLLADKLAVIQHETQVGDTGVHVPALVFTTLHPSCPMIMLNVVSDDYAVLDQRRCGCPLESAGLTTHLRGIRGYEKLNSEGMTFFGMDLFHVIEEILPAKFGGQPTDYQLAETEENGLPRVEIVVSPRLGEIVEEEIVAAVLEGLRNIPDGEMMTERWRESDTLRVARRDPYATPSAKVMPLHVKRR